MSNLILSHYDGALVNAVTGAGSHYGYSNAQGNWYPGGFLRIPEEFRANLDAESAECNRVCEVMPEEMAREWIEIKIADGDSKLLAALEEYDRRLKLRGSFQEAEYLRRLDDGSIIVLLIDDGRIPSDPVDEQNIKTIHPIRSKDILSRWMFSSSDLSKEPEYYDIYSSSLILNARGESDYKYAGWTGRVHHSRTLRFDNGKTNRWIRQRNDGWRPGALHRFIPSYIQYFNVMNALGQMVQKSSILTYTIEGLMQLFLDEQEDVIKRRLSENLMAASVYGAYIKDKDEQLEFAERSMTGYDQIVDRFERSLLIASGYPHSYLLGRTGPNGGLDGNGRTEEKLMAQLASQNQEANWRPLLESVYRLIFLAKDGPTKGKEPPKYTLHFKNLYQPSPQEESELRLTVAQADQIEMAGGILSAEDVVRSHYSQPEYNPTITVNWKRKEAELEKARNAQAPTNQTSDFFGTDLNADLQVDEPEEVTDSQNSIPRESLSDRITNYVNYHRHG